MMKRIPPRIAIIPFARCCSRLLCLSSILLLLCACLPACLIACMNGTAAHDPLVVFVGFAFLRFASVWVSRSVVPIVGCVLLLAFLVLFFTSLFRVTHQKPNPCPLKKRLLVRRFLETRQKAASLPSPRVRLSVDTCVLVSVHRNSRSYRQFGN